MKDLKEKTVRGGVAKLSGQAANFVLRIGQTMVLSRLLDPKDFGLVAMVTVVTGVYSIFTSAGLSSATVQRATVTDEQVSTLFWINILIGAVLGLLCLASAPVLVSFYHEPRLFWVTVAMAAGFLLNAAGVQHYALLQRQMRYIALTWIDIFSSLLSTAIGIGMAMAGFGYWALVVMTISYSVFSTSFVWLSTKWIPGKPRRGVGIRSMLRFGGTITLNGLVMYIGYNLEKLLLGRFWGADALGLYGRAYQVINIPTENINSAVGGLAFAGLSRVQHDPDRFKSYFLKGYSLVVTMTLFFTIFSCLFAEDIILVLMGPKWKDAVDIFRLLTPTVLIFGMINPLGWLLQSSGRQERSLKIALVIAPIVILSIAIGIPYGPKGVAFAYSTGLTLWLIPNIVWCIRGTGISLMDILSAVCRPYLSAIVAASITFGLQLFYRPWLSPFPRLVLGGSVMLGSYLLILLFVMGQKTFYLDLLRGLKNPSSPGIKESAEVSV
jgi:O-antigen/teichoic acid export membrane protein